jgi:regulator of protease activity HflC (stomatin/prohibitin superfamily)
MEAAIGIIVTFFLICLLAGGMYGCPQYNVYSQRLEGEAELAKAEYSRQVAVREAQAKRDSAALLAEAEITRAGGVAKANSIIGESLKNNEAYLRYLFVNELSQTKNQVIYVPTETQLPILEATRKPLAEK